MTKLTFKNFINSCLTEDIKRDAMHKAINFMGTARLALVDKNAINDILDNGKILKQEVIKTIADNVTVRLIQYKNANYVQVVGPNMNSVYKK